MALGRPAPGHPAAVSARSRRCSPPSGGIVGVILGALVALAVNQVFPAQVQARVRCLWASRVAAMTGLLAGLAPSSSASKLPPIEALRFE